MNNKTVFVLGAGASSQYGFPTGLELLKKIIIGINSDNVLFRDATEADRKKVRDLREDLYFSGLSSVDAFLQLNEKYLSVGKFLIGWHISKHENSRSLLMITEKDIDAKLDTDRKSWYREMWRKLSPDRELLTRGQISFVTFNYDRSLEYFLELCFRHSFHGGKNIDAAGRNKLIQELNQIGIIHAYGQLGFLDWQKKEKEDFIRSYASLKNEEIQDFWNICQRLDLVRSGSSLPVGIDKAREVLRNATSIYFLGFGFDEYNMELLGAMDGVFSSSQVIGATTLGLGKAEITRAMNYFVGEKVFASLPIDEYLREKIDWSKIFLV